MLMSNTKSFFFLVVKKKCAYSANFYDEFIYSIIKITFEASSNVSNIISLVMYHHGCEENAHIVRILTMDTT